MLNSIGFPELAIIAVFLALIVVPIWFSVRAKPLGSLPYRWGFYTSWQMFVSAIVCVLINGVGELFVVVPVALLFIGAAVGLFLRRRYGVVLLFICLVLSLLMGNELSKPGNAVLIFAILFIDFFYFKKRWPLLSPGFRSMPITWPQKASETNGSLFAIGPYRLNTRTQDCEGLREFSQSEYLSIERQFEGEKNYNAPSTDFLGSQWQIMLGTVQGEIYKIAAYLELRSKQEANRIAMATLRYVTNKLGTPSSQATGLFQWDAVDGNAILQTAEIAGTWSINFFLTSRSVRNFARKSGNETSARS